MSASVVCTIYVLHSLSQLQLLLGAYPCIYVDHKHIPREAVWAWRPHFAHWLNAEQNVIELDLVQQPCSLWDHSWFSRSSATKSANKLQKVPFLQSHPSDRLATPLSISREPPGTIATGGDFRKIH